MIRLHSRHRRCPSRRNIQQRSVSWGRRTVVVRADQRSVWTDPFGPSGKQATYTLLRAAREAIFEHAPASLSCGDHLRIYVGPAGRTTLCERMSSRGQGEHHMLTEHQRAGSKKAQEGVHPRPVMVS
jgi:hypothetical protein